MLSILHHLLQIVVVSHTHLHGVRVGLTEIGLGIVSQIVAILIPIQRIRGRRVFDTVNVAFGIRRLLEELPSTTRYLICTWGYMWFTNTDEGSWQHNLRRLDVLNERNTALEQHVDVHHVTLADWSNVCTRCIGLLIIVLINDGDNLLLREVEDIREAAYVQRTGLRRSNTVDGKVRLPVGKTVVVIAGDDNTHWNITTYSIVTTMFCTDARDTLHRDTFVVLTNGILLTTEIEGLVLLRLSKGQCGNICLIRVT